MSQFIFIIDPLHSLNPKKDSSIAMMQAAQSAGSKVFVAEQNQLSIETGTAHIDMREVQSIILDGSPWHTLADLTRHEFDSNDIVMMRKDPPVDTAFWHTLQVLSVAQNQGANVINNPRAVRDYNEKLFVHDFPGCIAPTVVSANKAQLDAFVDNHKDVVCKPLDGMGGEGIFRIQAGGDNNHTIFEMLTGHGKELMMLQQYLPEIAQGDKRILLIDGEPLEYALARMPKTGELRANLAAGGKGVAQPLSDRDKWLCKQVGPTLKAKGLMFVGVDVIGDYITEINVTSPTCIREIADQTGVNAAALLVQGLMQ
jgi:glutathione synthase